MRVEAFGEPVEIFGMTVRPNDLLHADRHGAVVIPLEAVDRLPAAIELLTRREAVILKAARNSDFDLAKLRAAMGEAEDIH